jgi:hypothetical protein
MGIGDIVTEKKKQIDECKVPPLIYFFFWFLVFVARVAAIDPGKQQFLPNAFEAHLAFHSLTELFSLSLSLSRRFAMG